MLNPTTDIPPNTDITVSIIGLTIDSCKLPSATFAISTKDQTGNLIEQDSWSLDTSTLVLGQVIVTSPLQLDVEALGQSTNFQVSFSIPSIADPGSYAILQVSDFSQLSTSSCTVNTAVFYGISCQVVSGPPFSFKLSFSQAIPAGTIITVQGKNVQNPKIPKTISTLISLYSLGGCQFLTGSASKGVSAIGTSSSFEVITTNKYLNVYTDYRMKLTPAVPSWNNNDYLIVEVPSGLSSQVTCIPQSPNIASMSCSLNNITSFKASLNVNSVAFPLNKTLDFEISYIMNPSQPGINTNFKTSVVTALGGSSSLSVFEKTPPVTGISYENYITSNFANISFTSNLRGYADYVKYNLSVNTLLAENSSIVVVLSKKFENLSQITLVSSSPSMQLLTTSVDSGKISLKLSSSVLPLAPLLFTLKQTNPTTELISPNDISIELLQGSSQSKITMITPIQSSLSFICDPSCQDCGKVYNQCTVCPVNYTLSGTQCLEKTKKPPGTIQVKPETSIPFIFLGIEVVVSILILVIGLLCKRLMFWGNFLYAILRPVYTAAIIFFVFFSYKNDESYWVLIAGICIVGIHVLISTIGTIFSIQAISKASLGAQSTENRFVNAFLDNYREKTADKIKIPRKKLLFTKIISPAVGFGVFRWFFSSKRTERGYFWVFDTPSFTFIKSVLQRFNMLYIFFVHIALIIVVSVSLAQAIYLFKIETICITILDLLIYVKAYFELNPFSLKKAAIKQKGKEISNKEGGDYHKLDNPDQSQMPDASRLHDNSNIGDDQHPGTPTRRRRDSVEDRNRLDPPLKSKQKRGEKDDLIDAGNQKTPSKTQNDEDGENQIKNTEDIFEYGTGKSLTSIPSGSEINLKRGNLARGAPQFNPKTDNTLEASTSNYSIVREISPDERQIVSHRNCLTMLPSNLKSVPLVSNYSSTKDHKDTGFIEKMKSTGNRLEVIYEEGEGDPEGRWNWQSSKDENGSKTLNRGIFSQFQQSRLGLKDPKVVKEVVGEQSCAADDHPWIVTDKNKKRLNLTKKNENGQFVDEEGRTFNLAYETEEALQNGYILDRRGQSHRLKDQDFKLLAEEGKLLNDKGEVVEIFGQNPKDLGAGVIKMDDDTTIKVDQQKDALLRKGIIIKEDGTCLNTKIPQDKNQLKTGIFLDKNGKPYRLIDQTAVALKANEVKGFGGCAIIEPKAPKKPNKAYFKTEDHSEDDPFRQDLSSKHSSLMMVKGETSGLKVGLIDLKPKRPVKQKTSTNDDDLSDYLTFPYRDLSEKEGDKLEKDLITKEFIRETASFNHGLAQMRNSGNQLTRPSPESKAGTDVPSIKFIPDSPYQPKVSNFINSSNIIKESSPVLDKKPLNDLEILSADQGKGPEVMKRESREGKNSGNYLNSNGDKEQTTLPGRSPNRTSTDKGKKRSTSP